MKTTARDTVQTLPGWLLPHGPFVTSWKTSKAMERPPGGVAAAQFLGLDDRAAGWKRWKPDASRLPFINVHDAGDDGLVYLATSLTVARAAEWG